MKIIAHRINDPRHLADLPPDFGAEIDVRYHEDELVLAHDPFGHHRAPLATLDEFCRGWHHAGPLILNIKSEGIEQRCIDVMARHGVRDWFFLDLSMPYFVRFAERAARREAGFGPERLAVRFSEREAIEYALGFAGAAGWVWVDCFARLPLDGETCAQLVAAGFRICVVSPELQGHSLQRIQHAVRQCAALPVAAVCTKHPQLWL